MRTLRPRLGLLLLILGLMLGGLGMAGSSATAQESNDDAPVIGEDPDSGEADTDTDASESVTTADSQEAADELAATGSWDRLLTPTGIMLIAIGSVLTMVGQPADPRGLHSRPSSKLRNSFFGLAIASISESVTSSRRPFR
jgi:hypothetical protein